MPCRRSGCRDNRCKLDRRRNRDRHNHGAHRVAAEAIRILKPRLAAADETRKNVRGKNSVSPLRLVPRRALPPGFQGLYWI